MTEDKIYLSWQDVEEAVNDLRMRLTARNVHYRTILGVSRGGVIPASLLHRHFPKARLAIINAGDSISLPYGETLIVDDIWDSGKTLEKFKFNSCSFTSLHSVSLVSKVEWTPNWHTYSGFIDSPDWIVFPWEVYDGN